MIEPMSRDEEHGHQPLTGPRGTNVADAIAQRVSCREVQDRFVMIAVKRSSNGGASAETQLRQQPFAMKDQRMDRFCFWIVLTPSGRCLNEESTPGAACSPTEFRFAKNICG